MPDDFKVDLDKEGWRHKKTSGLAGAANCITKLPKAEHDTLAWQAAIEALLVARPKHKG
jgi:hypothetical protein